MEINIKFLSDELCKLSSKESDYFPIDRFFIERFGLLKYVDKINSVNFIIYNLESTSNLYSEQLLVCLPELWDSMNFEKIRIILENLTNSFSFYSFLRFTYKYLEIDLIDDFVQNEKINIEFKKDVCSYFKNIVVTFYKDDDDFLDFNDNLIGIELNTWNQVQRILLNDKRIKPVSLNQKELLDKFLALELMFAR